MKTSLFFPIFSLLILAPVMGFSEQSSTELNRQAEVQKATQNTLPNGWYKVGQHPEYEIKVSNTYGLSDNGLMIKSKPERSTGFGGVGQRFSAENYLGKKVRLSGMIKTNQVENGYAGLWFRMDSNKKMLVLDNMFDRGVISTTDWQPYFSVLYIDPAATSLYIGAILTGNGEAYIDNLKIEIVSDDTQTTVTNKTGTSPINLGF